MRKHFTHKDIGFVFMDILIGLFIFGLGFVVMWGLSNSTILASGRSFNYSQAVNLASSEMDELISHLNQDSSLRFSLLSSQATEKIGKFNKVIQARWENQNLLLLTVTINWNEQNNIKEYPLESLYYCRD